VTEMSNKRVWTVRAGVGGRYFDEFKARSAVAIGWVDMGDMSALKTRDDISKAGAKVYPTWKPMEVAAAAGMLYRFVSEIKVGDPVLTYDPSNRIYLVGAITSEYLYDPRIIGDYPNVRRVQW